MNNVPITVLMPVYNGGKCLKEAVESILSQTFDDFEFLIINDGSTDDTRDILESYNDPRIRLIHTDNNGVATALNMGVEMAKGKYIARMDADDISLPNRLEIEKDYLDRNPDVAVIHGMVDYIDRYGNIIRRNVGVRQSTVDTKWLLLWKTTVIHPTVMIRAEVLRRNNLNYRVETNLAEDFDLWSRLSLVGDFLFLPQVLLRYRFHNEKVTNLKPVKMQIDVYSNIVAENFKRFGINLNKEVAEELAVISGHTKINPIQYNYKHLSGKLHRLSEDVSEKFVKYFSMDKKDLSSIKAKQLVLWARYFLHTSKRYALKLLYYSLRQSQKVFISYRFYAVCIAMILPRKYMDWLTNFRIFLGNLADKVVNPYS